MHRFANIGRKYSRALVGLFAALQVGCSGVSQTSSSSRESQSADADSTVSNESHTQSTQNVDGLLPPEILAGSYLIQNLARTQDPAMLRASVILVKDTKGSTPTRVFPLLANQMDGITWILVVDGKSQSFKGRISASLTEAPDDMSWLLPLRADQSVPMVKVMVTITTRGGDKVSVDRLKTSAGSLESSPSSPPKNSAGEHLFFTTMHSYPPLEMIQRISDIPDSINGQRCSKLVDVIAEPHNLTHSQLLTAKANAICQCEASVSESAPVLDARNTFEAVMYPDLYGDMISLWESNFRTNFPNAVRGSNGLLMAEAGQFLPNLSLDRSIWGQSNFILKQSPAIDQNGIAIETATISARLVQTGIPDLGATKDLTKSSNCKSGNLGSDESGQYFGLGLLSGIDESAFFSSHLACGISAPLRLYCISR